MADEKHKRLLETMARYQEEDARRRRVIEFDWRTSARRDHGLIKGNPIRAPEALQLTLSQDRVARLSNLYQYATYAGTLAGIPPNPEITILTAIEFSEKLHPEHPRPPVILEPVFETGAISRQVENATREMGWVLLSPVCTIAKFDSDSAIKPEDDGSRIVVIWFQEQFGVDLDNPTTERLRAID